VNFLPKIRCFDGELPICIAHNAKCMRKFAGNMGRWGNIKVLKQDFSHRVNYALRIKI
jgi:hypothetical protein